MFDDDDGRTYRHVSLSGFDLDRRADDPVDDLRSLFLDHVVVRGGDVDLTHTHVGVAWSELEDVRFRQRGGPVLAPSGAAAQGSFGVRDSVYRRCTFEGVRFKTLGGFSLGRARYEECTFVDCRWEGHLAHDADLIGCTFRGRMNGCVWFGASSDEPGARRNELRDNDFTDVRFTTNVAWRSGFPLEAQRFPDGFEPIVDDAGWR